MSRTRSFLAALAIGLPGLAQAALLPAGNHYRLNVTTSFESPFTDCWTFASNGSFIHSTSLGNFPYQLDDLNRQAGAWQAIWVGKVSIAFSGTATASTLSGNAVDRNGHTYSITGSSTGGCAKSAGKSWAGS